MKAWKDIGQTTIHTGLIALKAIRADSAKNTLTLNEAETRFHVIDRIIVDCLGWPRESLRLEQSQGRAFTDYELGHPRQAIWEAKREGRTFELPANPKGRLIHDLPSICALGGEVLEAIRQVQDYCSRRGVEIAVATNGHQLVAFIASRGDGKAPLEGKALVCDGYDALERHFPQIWQALSPAGVAEKRLHRLLTIGEDAKLPAKLSGNLHNYPRYRYPSNLQSSLRSISELLLIDAMDQADTEQQFYKECYCESGALSQHALISKQMLAARYSSMFDPTEKGPNVSPIRVASKKAILTPEVLSEASAQRPIVLLGDVGVGKTAFLKHLIHVSAYDEFKQALYIYIDLGSRGALNSDLNEFVLSEIERQLIEKYEVDVDDAQFVRGVYDLEIARFRKGIYGSLAERNPEAFEDKLLEFLSEKSSKRDRHLRDCIAHLAKGRRKHIVIVIDNADQRSDAIQQDAFIIAQSFSKEWRATVFIAVQPRTFYASKQSGALRSYPNRVFTIAPPRIDSVIERRLTFALNMAEGRVKSEMLSDIGLRLDSIALFLKALLHSLRNNDDLVEFLSNITGGNIRESLAIVVSFIGSANVDSDKIIEFMAKGERYVVPVHEFWKSALLGEFSYFDPETSLALNLFDIRRPNPEDHFLAPMILAFLDSDGKHKTKEGFVSTVALIAEMQGWGFTPDIVEDVIRRANNKKLIENSSRVTFAEDGTGLIGSLPDNFRITTIGAYHLQRWLGEFAYLDAVSYDTSILDEEVREQIRQKIESFAIADRLDRARSFRSYLIGAWHRSRLSPPYFDLRLCFESGGESFERVERAVSRLASQRPS